MADEPQDDAGLQPPKQEAGPEAREKEARLWATLCHVAGVVGMPIGPFVIWLLKREEFPLVDEQGKEAVNFQITMLIAWFCGLVTIPLFIGFFVMPAVIIFDLIMIIMAAMKTNEGERWKYPVSLRLVK